MVTQLENWPKEWTKPPGFEKFQDIIYEKKYFFNGGVARLNFCYEVKPGFPAWRHETFNEFAECLADASHDESIGVVVMTSGSTHFMTGGDMNWEAQGGLNWEFEFAPDLHRSMRRCRKPIIAAVKGYCIDPHLGAKC